MANLILHPTDTSQWYHLVNEAQASTQLVLNENTESYLVFLLMRFARTTDLIESIVAIDFLESMMAMKKLKTELLTQVGDKCLLLAGMFPGIANRRGLALNYFTDMGQVAYSSVASIEDHAAAKLYIELSEAFLVMQQILQAMQGTAVVWSDLDLSLRLEAVARVH